MYTLFVFSSRLFLMLALFLIPVLMLLAVMFMYRFSGKKEFLQMDLVQFLYAFVIYPIGYIWIKNFIYLLLREEIGVRLTLGQLITIDTVFTVLFLYMYAFGIIHALTKTFSLNLNRDPFYDMFDDSKYFHEFLSHVGMYAGVVMVMTVLSLINGLFPFQVVNNKLYMDVLVGLGWFAGFLTYIGMFFSTDKGFQYSKYKRIMKLLFGSCFTLEVLFYFAFRPKFALQYGWFWFILLTLTSTIVSMFIFSPGRRFGKLLQRLPINGID